MEDFDSVFISSMQNTRIKQAVKLRDRSERNKTECFLIEGYRELLRSVDAGWKTETLFYCPEFFLGTNESSLIARIADKGAQVLRCSEPVFKKISYRDRPDGLLAIAPQRHLTLSDLDRQLISKNPFLIVAEAIEKPGNLGTILRCSDAVGLDALILSDPCTDIFNPNVVRASVGTLFTVPVVESKGEEVIKWLENRQISILAATPHATKEFTEVDLTGPIAIAVGTEQLGLSQKMLEKATLQVRIPMCGIADSLNVAMATTVLLYEALRQRRVV